MTRGIGDSKSSAAQDRASGTIWLQSVGRVKAKAASQFKVGEKIMWNYGVKSLITKITPKASRFEMVIEEGGKAYVRTFNADRMLAIGFSYE